MFRVGVIVTAVFLLYMNPFAATGGALAEPRGRLLSEQELVDMLVGSCIQSTRGCDSAPLIDTVRQALASGKQFRLLTMSSIPNIGW